MRMRLAQASLSLLVAASACATFTSTDTEVTGDAGAPGAPDAAADVATPTDGGALTHYCATKIASEDHACFDFDDGVLPDLASGWLVDKKGADMTTVLPGGAHGSAFALELSGQRAIGGASTGAGIRHPVGGGLPKALTASLSAQRSFVNGTTSDGSQNYDLLVVTGSTATQKDRLQVELRPDGNLSAIDVVTNADGGPYYSRPLVNVAVPTLGQRFTDIVLTISFTSVATTATLSIGGAVVVKDAETQLGTMTTIDDVTWADPALAGGVAYRMVIDDLTLDITR